MDIIVSLSIELVRTPKVRPNTGSSFKFYLVLHNPEMRRREAIYTDLVPFLLQNPLSFVQTSFLFPHPYPFQSS